MAQSTNTVTGVVLDSVSRQSVAFATVVLLPGTTGTNVLANAITNEQGRFTLTTQVTGASHLLVRFVGYAAHTQALVVGSTAITLPPILLVPATQHLDEAIVVGTRPLVEVRPDRLVYHAAQDIGVAGGTATDVLRKTPLLAVDGVGNVTMRGSANFKVLVDNHPSPTLAQNLTQALKGIPADQLESVEVITTPSAKDDGEGTAGIINIVLKKGTRRNLNGHVGASGGNRASELTSALGFRRGKVGLNLTASTGRWLEPDQLTRRRLGFSSLGVDTLTQSGRRDNTGTWYNSTLSLDYDPAEHQHFALNATLGGYRAQAQRDLVNRFSSPDATRNDLFTRATTDFVGSRSTELTGTYVRTFAQPRREWSALAQYARTAGTFGYDFAQYEKSAVAQTPDRADYRERSRGRTPSQEVTLQADATQPVGEKRTLEFGVKAIFRRTGSQATVAGLRPGQATEFTPLVGRATDFLYTQQVQAAYASYATAINPKLAATLGSRVERTALAADFRASGTALPPTSYYSLLPNASVQVTFRPDTSGLRLAYSRRITRPYIDYLNPFVDRSNPQNITYGNPGLVAELTDAYEVSYHTLVHQAPVVVSGTVRHTGNAIETVRLPTTTPGVTAQTYANVTAVTYYQLTLYGTVKFTKWEVSGGPNVQRVVFLSPDREMLHSGLTAGMNADTSCHFAHRLTAQASIAGSLPAPTLQGQSGASLYYALSVKKGFLGEKADVTVNVANPFTDSFPSRSLLTTAFAAEQTEYRTYQRAVRVSLNYRFGQDTAEHARKQANNDDLKGR